MRSQPSLDELGVNIVGVLVVGATVALYIMAALCPEVSVPTELKLAAAAVLGYYGIRVRGKHEA